MLTKSNFIVAMFQISSMNLSNRAMKIIAYPFVILSKSAKVLAVIFIGTLRGIYHPTKLQYFIAVVITIGLVLFNMGKVS